MVTEIPTDAEVLGLEDNSFQPETPDVDESMDMDEQLMYVALFAVLATLYNDFEHKGVDYILAKFPEAVTKAGEKLAKNSKTELTKLIEDHKVTVLKDYNIHEKVIPQVKLNYNLKGTFDTMESSVKSTINQLKDDVRTKALAVKEKMAEVKNFNLKSNFQRAAKRTKNYVKFNAQFAKQKVTRSAQEMRYGSAMLYYWVVRGINTCQKCYDRARLPAQTIDQWPYDHPNGHCRLVPVSDDSTKEYQGYLALSQKYADLSLI